MFAWFVSGLAIKSEPLGKLTRYIEIFFWGQKQEKSFRKLNENIFTNAKTVGYIDTEAKTQFVTDAGLGDVLQGKTNYLIFQLQSDVENAYYKQKMKILA